MHSILFTDCDSFLEFVSWFSIPLKNIFHINFFGVLCNPYVVVLVCI